MGKRNRSRKIKITSENDVRYFFHEWILFESHPPIEDQQDYERAMKIWMEAWKRAQREADKLK